MKGKILTGAGLLLIAAALLLTVYNIRESDRAGAESEEMVVRMESLTAALPERLEGARYLILDGLQDPGNVGTIWRTADALGADGLILINRCADPYGPKAVRASMGACFRLPVYEGAWEQVLPLLERSGLPVYAAALGEHTQDVKRADLRRSAVVIGSEGQGISPQVLAACGQRLKIPMRARCESLNAAVAAAVILWEMGR